MTLLYSTSTALLRVYITDNGFERLLTLVFIFPDELNTLRKGLLLGANPEGGIFLTIGVDAHASVAPL